MAAVSALHLGNVALGRVKSALRMSAAEGMAYGTFVGFGDHFIGAFAVALEANSLEIGVLSSVPGFLASIAQLSNGELVRLLKSRKAVVLAFVLAQGLMLLPMLSLAFIPRSNPAWWLIFYVSLYSIFGAVVTPAWGSLMAEVVPENLRGRYFAIRGQLSTLATLVSFFAGGLFLQLLVHRSLWGFAVLFGAAFAARLVSWLLLTQLYEAPGRAGAPAKRRSAFQVPGLLSTNLGRYMLFLFAMSFAVQLGSPYFTVYLLRDLRLNYLTFTVLEAISPLAILLAITHWGRAADRAGNLRMLYYASALVPFVPLLWLVSSHVVYLGLVQVFSGLAWAGFNLCSVNYLYDATSTENRTRFLAFFNAGNGVAMGVGALAGGLLVTHLPAVHGSHILTLFLISGTLRAAATILFLPLVKEVRRVSKVSAAELFHIMMGGRPVHRRMGHRRMTHVTPLHAHEPEGQ